MQNATENAAGIPASRSAASTGSSVLGWTRWCTVRNCGVLTGMPIWTEWDRRRNTSAARSAYSKIARNKQESVTVKLKTGDLVQVLPAKIGFYIVLGRTQWSNGSVSSTCWNLQSVSDIEDVPGLPMDEKFIEVVCESR